MIPYDESTNRYTLSSGRRVYAYGNMLAIDPEGRLVYGHDGIVDVNRCEDGGDALPLTREERVEIANMMIERWLKWVAQ